ncbi:MAG: type II secretion system F family protein [Candidatus Methanomethyliaceae archaeon]
MEDSKGNLKTRLLDRLQYLGSKLIPAQNSEEIRIKLLYAGLRDRLQPEQFWAIKLVAGSIAGIVVSVALAVGMGMGGVLLGVSAAGAAYMAPELWLNSVISERRKKVEKNLLGFCDTLALAMEAGLPLGLAIRRVSESYPGELAMEFLQTIEETNLGRPEREALADLEQRVGSEEVKMLTSAIAQAQELGVPVAPVLRGQSEQIRKSRQLKAQELAQKASVKMLGPVIVFMFIPMLILMMGPAMVNLVKGLGF